MSAKRRSKRDVDRFVSQINEKERVSRGYQIALLYHEVGEQAEAKKYLSLYMSTRNTMHQAHKLMGQIHQAVGEKDQAVASYKRSLELNPNQKDLLLKICELYTAMRGVDPEILKYWASKAKEVHKSHPVLLKLEEKILSSSATDGALEEFYRKQLSKNSGDVSVHIKLMDLYLGSNRPKQAYHHAVENIKTMAFVSDLSWNEYMIKLFHAYSKVERVALDPDYHTNKLFVLCNLVFLKIKESEVIDSATVLHQLDQGLFEAILIQNNTKEWNTFLSEMQAQYYFLFGLLLVKRAQKGLLPWKDSSMFAILCFLASNQFGRLDTRTPWFAQLKLHVKKFFDRLEKMSCYRLIQGGCVTLSLIEGENTSRMPQVRQLRTLQVREKLYDLQYTLPQMRDKKGSSYILRSETFMKTPLVPPTRQALAEYESGVFELHGDSLHELVWVAMSRPSPKDQIQQSYPLHISDRLKYSADLTAGSPEALCVLDIHAFFYLTVNCSSSQYSEQIRNTRKDPYKPYLLPACICQPLCLQQQSDWWTAMRKFCNNSAKEGFAKLRLTLQRGIETVRLIGSHGVSPQNVLLLAKTFDERVKDMKAVEFDGNSHCTKLEALEIWAAHYWKEAMVLLSKIERNLKIPCPKERLFPDIQTMELDSSQVPELIEQAKFSLATVAMRESRYEDAKEMFETLKSPWASFHLSQIYRTLADQIDCDTDEGTSQQIALVERSLDMLYQTMDKIQTSKNHELHRVIPTDIDECVNFLERLRAGAAGGSLVESVLYEREGSDKESVEESFSTPTGHDRGPKEGVMYLESPTLPEPPTFSTPAVTGRVSASNYSLTQRSGGKPRPSPERLDARIWVLETKLQSALDMMQEMREKLKEIDATQNKYRTDQIEMQDLIRQMKDQLSLSARQNAQLLAQPPLPATYRPHPAQYSFTQGLQTPWGAPVLGYQPASPGPGGGPARRGMGRTGQMSIPSDIEDEFYQFGEDCYEDDGSQPPPPTGLYGPHDAHAQHGLYGLTDAQLEQNWPFGHKAGLEGKSTITYAPQIPAQPPSQSRMPQPGFFGNALRGMALQYAQTQTGSEGQLPQQPQSSALQGQNLFIGQGLPGHAGVSLPPGSSAPMLAQALAARSPVVTATAAMPPNAVAGQHAAGMPSLVQGTAGVASPAAPATGKPAVGLFGQPGASTTTTPGFGMTPSTAGFGMTPSTGSPMPLFGSLVAASKSPDKPVGQTTTVSATSVATNIPSFASLATGSTPAFGSISAGQGSGSTPSFASLAAGSGSKPVPAFGSTTPGSTSVFGSSQPTTTQAGSSPFAGFSGFGTKPPADKQGTTVQGGVQGGTPKPLFTPTTPSTQSPQKANASQGSTPGQSPRKRNDSMEEYEPTADFKPVLAELPDLVELKSGEEEEERLFSERAKLFRFDKETKQWKERGIGDMRILRHYESGKIRILMRREQVLKLCANHVLTKEMKLTPMAGSDRAWCWVANDFSEEEIKLEQLAIKFKSVEQAQKFKEVFEDAQKSLTEAPGPQDKTEDQVKDTKPPQQSLSEMFKPKTGSWSCSGCLIQNSGDVLKCPACYTLKPGVKPEDVPDSKPASTFPMGGGGSIKIPGSTGGAPSGGFKFGSSGGGGFTFGTPTTTQQSTGSTPGGFSFTPAGTKPSTGTTPANTTPAGTGTGTGTGTTATPGGSAEVKPPQQQSLSEMFKPKTGSWSCSGCLIQNSGDVLKCPACYTLKPGVKPGDVPDTKPASTFPMGGGGGIKVGGTTGGTSTGGFTFGSGSGTGSGGFKFGSATATSTTTANTSTTGSTPAGGFKFGSTATTATTTPTPSNAGSTPAGGFKFTTSTTPSTSGGPTPATQPMSAPTFTFKSTLPSTTSVTATKPATATSGFAFGTSTTAAASSPFGGFSFGKPEKPAVKAEADSTKEEKEGEPPSQLAELLQAEVETWICTKCRTPRSVNKCPACGVLKPGVKPEGEEKPKLGLGTFSFTPSSGGFNFGAVSQKSVTESKASLDISKEKPKAQPAQKVGESKKAEEKTGFQFSLEPKAVTPSKPGEKKEGPSGFQFTFTPSSSVKSPKSPEVDKDGMYVNKEGEDDHIYFEPIVQLPEKVPIVTGEENENVLFQHRAKLFRFHNKEWKERGLGDIKILENKDSKKIRVVMRREQILKICCNHYLTPDMELKMMPKCEGKAWLWHAMDFADGEAKNEQLSVKFKSAEIANSFKEAFDNAKMKVRGGAASTPTRPVKGDTASATGSEASRKLFEPQESRKESEAGTSGDGDVEIIKVERATPEQIERARKFQLPDHFYLYETKPECPGCIGCEDYEPGKKLTPVKPKKSPKKDSDKPSTSGGSQLSQSTPVFGSGSQPSTSRGLFGEGSTTTATGGGLFGLATASGGGDSANSSVFGASSGPMFGTSTSDGFSFASLAAKSSTSPSGFHKDDTKPFHWSGAGQQLFGASAEGDDSHHDGDEVIQGEDPHFEPVIELPDLVEIKTGEEDCDKIFCHRAKLFRFDKDTNQWKEKGIGEMKILKNRDSGKYRLLLRREQVLKLACNHWLTPDLNFQKLQTSETSWCWVAQDFSENEPKMEQFAVKFKTVDLANEFKARVDECQADAAQTVPQQVAEEVEKGSDQALSTEAGRSQASSDKTPVQVTEEDDHNDEDEDDEDYEDVEETIFEKRVTFFARDGEDWKVVGLGILRVVYDDDVNGNKVLVETDKKEIVCNHLIARESAINVVKKKRYCEWSPIDFSTDEPVRRHFRAQFSSESAVEEFEKFFKQGRLLAVDSEISESDMMVVPREITVPDVYGQAADED